ncbi:glycosyltransferase family 2 protein [Marisediminicola senii]|uniref:glycosyltransferase family 2 protein n=1 Tax=Marisediminicola senii TaxID=2711233 RepID=UPI001F3CD84E|nr:glycosyltransferase family 2 protein [Marisediminicola senii]
MTLVMTMMVRDEADVISAWLDHHLAQGVDMFVITDNASVDGTTEILEEYASRGRIDLRHDPEHRKQQGTVVTRMARDAHTMHGADWVINADADEFWMPRAAGRTLSDVFAEMPTAYRSFTVAVTDMIGAPALEGSGLQRLTYRDLRPANAMKKLGLLDHATPVAVHVGDPDVIVSQGNHLVSIESKGEPGDDLAIDVLHFPWRSWSQFSRKVEVSGRAYESNPHLTPSANHHGMRDYGRLKRGTLLPYYVMRHPAGDELAQGILDGYFVPDSRIADSRPSPVADVAIDPALEKVARALGRELHSVAAKVDRLEPELAAATARAAADEEARRGQSATILELAIERDNLVAERDALRADRDAVASRLSEAERLLRERFTDRALRVMRGRAIRARSALRQRGRSGV